MGLMGQPPHAALPHYNCIHVEMGVFSVYSQSELCFEQSRCGDSTVNSDDAKVTSSADVSVST